jgi:nitroreductase
MKTDIHPLLRKRSSPQNMGGKPLRKKEFIPLFEAARWAPSSYNAQLWRFVYVLKKSKRWPLFLRLIDANNSWAKDASVLVIVVTRKNFEYNNKRSRTATFDAGAACENLALEGTRRGLAVHLMEGFDYEKAAQVCNISKKFEVLVMIAIGRKMKLEKRSTRRPLKEIVFEGTMKKGEKNER